MAEPHGDGSIDSRRRGAGKRSGGSSHEAAATEIGPTIPNPPCGACKFLRRKCVDGCIFAPYFASDQGAARFAAVHKVFGASNVSKLLLHIPVNHRHDAIVTICYEAQARLSDPVYGCVSTVLALQQQVASLQAELAMVQSQLINSRLAVANALQSSQQQPPDHLIGAMLQPAFSNASSSSNNLLNMNSFNSGLNLSGEAAAASNGFEPLQLTRPSRDDEDEDEEEGRSSLLFANQILHSR